jgi:hypothetical protein
MKGPRLLYGLPAAISLLLSSLVAPAALAQQSPFPLQGAVTQTATISSFTPGPAFTDALGNTLLVGSVYTGPISGTPITGSFRFDGDFQHAAGAAVGEFHGSFVASDGVGNALYGLADGSEVLDALGNASLRGRFEIQGGTGLYVNATGGGQLSGLLDVTPVDQSVAWSAVTLSGTVSLGNPATTGVTPALPSTPALLVAPPTQNDQDDVRPGWGFGDRNHVHSGPPGQNRGQGHGRQGHD